MKNPSMNRLEHMAESVRGLWTEYNKALLYFAVAIMAIVAVGWLGYQFWRLLSPTPPIWPTSPRGAVDLLQRFRELGHWYDVPGRPTYNTIGSAVYPPATYVILWPFLGWMDAMTARWIWAITTVFFLGWLTVLSIRESHASSRLEQVFVGLIPLSTYATGATIGNGQLNIHILPLLLSGVLMLGRRPAGGFRDLSGAGMFILALTKPTVSGPFFWLVLFVRRSARPTVLVVIGYVVITVFASSFKDQTLEETLTFWLMKASGAAAHGAVRGAVANQSTLLMSMGMKAWLIPMGLLGVLVMGCWMYMHRRVDHWILLGVFGLLTRLGFYHRWYDDMLILPAMIALYIVAKQGTVRGIQDVIAGLLFAILLLTMLAPGALYFLASPYNTYATYFQVSIWSTTLVFLLSQAWATRKNPQLPPNPV